MMHKFDLARAVVQKLVKAIVASALIANWGNRWGGWNVHPIFLLGERLSEFWPEIADVDVHDRPRRARIEHAMKQRDCMSLT
jgi:hypothetical protein